MLEVYSGDVRGDEEMYGAYGNSPFGDPYFAELELPEIKEMARQIRERVPDGERLLGGIEGTWLCAPRVFRYLEKLVLEIGNIGSEDALNIDVSILQCEDTYPDIAFYQKHYLSFMSSLADWLNGDSQAVSELGDMTPAKHWLARMLRHKIELYEKHDDLGKFQEIDIEDASDVKIDGSSEVDLDDDLPEINLDDTSDIKIEDPTDS